MKLALLINEFNVSVNVREFKAASVSGKRNNILFLSLPCINN